MTRIEWLTKKHHELEAQVESLEHEREHNRDFDHKTLLQDLKKQKLAVKTELNQLQS